MRARIPTPLRYCQDANCGRSIPRRYKDGAARYNARVYCSRACRNRNATFPSRRPRRRCRNGSPLVAKMAHDLYFIGRLKQRDIMRMFGVSQPTVSRYINGETWIHTV